MAWVDFVWRVSLISLAQDVRLECFSDNFLAGVCLSRPCVIFSDCWSVSMHRRKSLSIVVPEFLWTTAVDFTALFYNSMNVLQPYLNDALFSAKIVPLFKKRGGAPNIPRPPTTP